MIASGTPCLRVAQKESRKHLVGDKALEKYALRFGVLQPGRRSSQSLSTQHSTRPFTIISFWISNDTSITANLPYQGQAVNRKSCLGGLAQAIASWLGPGKPKDVKNASFGDCVRKTPGGDHCNQFAETWHMFRAWCTSRNLSRKQSDRQQMQATCIGCRDCKHYRGAQSITIASGTSCLQVAQKESRKRLVGDKALEKYALQIWGATARAAILATVAHAPRNTYITSRVTNSIRN